MGLDYEKLKRAAEELQARMARGGGGPSMKFWKPKSGKNTVRILPPWTTEGVFAGQFYREVHQHWNVKEESGPILCPKKTPNAAEDKDCPICEFVDQLRLRKNDVEAQEIVKDLRAKIAYLMSIIDMDDPEYTAKDVAEWKKEKPDSDCPFEVGDTKIQCYAATSTIADAIMNVVLANNMDITDLNAGHNLFITKIPNKDPLKTRYSVTADLNKTKAPVAKDAKMPDLAKIGKVSSYDDMAKLLSEGRGGNYSGLLTSGKEAKFGSTAVSSQIDPTAGSYLDGGDLADEMRRQLGE